MSIFFRTLSVLLSGILAAGSCLQAQNVTPADSSDVQELHIRVVEGADSGRATTQPLTVAITDGRGSPVPNATVLFRLPSDAPTGIFSDGSRVAVLYTDMEGHAAVKNIQWGASSGTAVIRVTASKGAAHAGLLIEQVLSSSKIAAAAAPPSAPPTVSAAPVASATPVPETAGIVHPAPMGQPAPVGQPALAPAERSGKPILISAQGTTVPTSTASEEPTVQITTNRPVQLTGASGKSKKWLWIGIGGAAAAGMAFAFVGKGGGSGSSQTPGSPSLSIGTPSVSIGHP